MDNVESEHTPFHLQPVAHRGDLRQDPSRTVNHSAGPFAVGGLGSMGTACLLSGVTASYFFGELAPQMSRSG